MSVKSMRAFVALTLLAGVVRATDSPLRPSSLLTWFRDGRETISECRDSRLNWFDAFTNRSSLSDINDCVEGVFLETLDRAVASTRDVQLNDYVSLVGTNETFGEMESARSEKDADLTTALTNRIHRFFDTHSLKISLKALEEQDDQVEGRHRHRLRKAFPMMVAGFILMAAIMVPQGFQFMAVISTKALLIAKLAFLISVFSGYRRVASDLDYHHHHEPHHHHPQIQFLGHSGGGHSGAGTSGLFSSPGLYGSPLSQFGLSSNEFGTLRKG